jgi:hypothetical protein
VRPTTFSGLVLLASAVACAHRAPPPASGLAADESTAPVRGNRDVITTAELNGPNVVNMTVLEAVKALRPHFLTVRGATTFVNGNAAVDPEAGNVHASIDGNKVVELDELNSIRAGTVAEVRYLNAAAAMQRFGGTAREGPVILVKTVK